MKRAQLSRGIISLFAVMGVAAFAQTAPRFQTTANGADPITPISGRHVFGVGFYAETVYPFGRPFASTVTNEGTQDMRFQVPVGFGLEASYGITRNIETALSFGYENFKTQNFREQSGAAKTFDIAKYTFFPVMALVRYRWPRKGWAPEAEAGIGSAFGTIDIRETKTNPQTFKENSTFIRGHIAGGAAFSWADYASLHFIVGYGVSHLGAKNYEGTNMHVEQKANLQGIFSKAYLKFYF